MHVDLAGLLTLPGTKTDAALRDIPLRDHVQLRELMEQVLTSLPADQRRLFAPWSNIRRDLHDACKRVKASLAAEADRAAKGGRAGAAAALQREAEGFPLVSPNDLRRTFGKWCRLQGMASDRIAVLLGHTDSRMVERVYGRLDASDLGADVARVFAGLDLPAWMPWQRTVIREHYAGEHDQHGEAEDRELEGSLVPRDGVEPPTRGFSVRCSTS